MVFACNCTQKHLLQKLHSCPQQKNADQPIGTLYSPGFVVMFRLPLLRQVSTRGDLFLQAGCYCFHAGLGLLDLTDTVMLPAPAHEETRITGYPEGRWLNYVTWSKDSRHIAFAVRSPGKAN